MPPKMKPRTNSILITISALFVCQVLLAADYRWAVSGSQGWYFPSPNIACNWIMQNMKGTSYQLTYNSDIKYLCDVSTPIVSGGHSKFSVNRTGTSCPNGSTYNPTTGACGIDQQKGGPTSALSCSVSNSGPSLFAGDPINTANGNSTQVEFDYIGNGVTPLVFSRTYNSVDGLWLHSYATYLRFAGNNIALVRADGRESYFIINGSTIAGSTTELGELTKLADGWEYRAENNERFTFDIAGNLTYWKSPTGQTLQLSRANGVVVVADNLGQTLSFTEDFQHQPLTLTGSGLQIAYSYNANKRMTSLARTAGSQTSQRQFHYEDNRNPNWLTGITDEHGLRYTSWTFDDQGRTTSSERTGGAEHIQIVYNSDGSATVTNEFGKNTVYRFQTIEGIKRITVIEGQPSANCPNSNSTFTYNGRGLLQTKVDNKGNLTTYDYNDRGLETSRTEASGTPQARTVTTEWHPTLFLKTKVTEPDRITTYQYDAQGRQTGQIVTPR